MELPIDEDRLDETWPDEVGVADIALPIYPVRAEGEEEEEEEEEDADIDDLLDDAEEE